MAKLYIVPTPIGNLDDITLRAVDVLREVDFILAEDTRTTSFLLRHLGIEKNSIRTTSSTNTPRSRWWPGRLPPDAMPRWFRTLGHPVSPIRGFCWSGRVSRPASRSRRSPVPRRWFPLLCRADSRATGFVSRGFCPRKGAGEAVAVACRRGAHDGILRIALPGGEMPRTVRRSFGSERRVSVSRELTKKFEQTVRGTVAEVLEHFRTTEPKGEFVIVLAGKPKPKRELPDEETE